MTLGERIKMLRIQKNLTQQQLATLCGYKSLTTINKIEMGINSVPISTIEKLSFALDVTPAYLMGWDDVEEDNFTQDEIKIIHALRQNPEAKSILELIFSGSDEEIKELSNYIDFILSKRR